MKHLHFLRKITRKGYQIRGVARICEIIRKHYAGKFKEVCLNDFDTDLIMKVDVSEHIGSKIFWRGFCSEDQLIILNQILAKDSVFFDIGANIGEFTLFAAKRIPEGKVYAFEPVSNTFHTLRDNINQNKFLHVYPQNIALSDREGEAEIFLPTTKFFRDKTTYNNGLPSLFVRTGNERSEKILLTTLDSFVDKEGIEKIDVIKIDVEGSELPVLHGAKQMLQSFLPKIIIEINKATSSMGGYESQDILTYLRSLGYVFQRINKKGILSEFHEHNISHFQNILCVHQSKV